MRAVHRLLTVVGTLLLLLGTIAGVLHREVLDADRFADHVDAVRADPAVSRQLGGLVTARLLAAQPDLTAIRPLVESTATALVASPALGSTVRSAAVGPLYRSLTDGGRNTVVLRLADVAALVVGVVNVAAPEQRAALPAELDVRLSAFGGQDASGDAVRWVHLVRWMSWVLPLLGLLVLVVAGATLGADDRARRARLSGALGTVGRGALGAAAGLAALLVLVGFLTGRLDDGTLSGAVVRAVWHELDGDFWVAAGVLAATGYVLTLLARPGPGRLARDLGPRALVAHAWSQMVDPGPRLGARTYRAVFVGLAGVALVLQPLELFRALLWATGLVLVVTAVALLVPIVVEAVREKVLHRARAVRPRAQWQHVAGVAALLALVLILVVGAWPAHDDAADAFGHDDSTCNGDAALCDRPYDAVAFPATHNSMSAANEPGWFFAEQPDGIVAQLDHGIRVLLVDSWYGQRDAAPRDHRQRRRQPRRRAHRGAGVVRRGLPAQRPPPARCPEPDSSWTGGAVPVPRAVRARLDEVAAGDEGRARLAGRPPARGRHGLRAGHGEPGRHRRGVRQGRTAALRLHTRHRRAVAHARPDDRVRSAAGGADGEPRRRYDVPLAAARLPVGTGDAVPLPAVLGSSRAASTAAPRTPRCSC